MPHKLDQEQFGSVTILDVGRMDHHRAQEPQRVYRNMPLAALNLLAGVIAADPPFSVVLTLWL